MIIYFLTWLYYQATHQNSLVVATILAMLFILAIVGYAFISIITILIFPVIDLMIYDGVYNQTTYGDKITCEQVQYEETQQIYNDKIDELTNEIEDLKKEKQLYADKNNNIYKLKEDYAIKISNFKTIDKDNKTITIELYNEEFTAYIKPVINDNGKDKICIEDNIYEIKDE